MCIKCYETHDIQITDDGWIPVQHAIHRELQLAIVRIPMTTEKERAYYTFLAAYLAQAQLPFIQTVYDYFPHKNELILIVRRPQITLNDFLLKAELTDNQNQLAAYSIAMGVFMAHRHKLYVNEFSFRDVLIFEDQYICLSVKQFFRLPCGCWNSRQDLANLAYKCLLLNNMSNISQFPDVFRTCRECGRTNFDLGRLEDVNSVFMRCNSSNSSVFKLSEVIFKEFNWAKIVNQTFLSTARIAPNVDGSKMVFANQICRFQHPKSNKQADQQLYESKDFAKVMMYTGIRNKSQTNMPPEIMKAANQLAHALKLDENDFLTYLDPLYSPSKKEETQLDELQNEGQNDGQNEQGKTPLEQYLRANQQIVNNQRSPYEMYLQQKKGDDLLDVENEKSQLSKLTETQRGLLKRQLMELLKPKKENVDLYAVFIATRLFLQNSEFQMKMSDQPFPLDVFFSEPQYQIASMQFPAFLKAYELEDLNLYQTLADKIIPLVPLYESNYKQSITQYAGLLVQSWSQMLTVQALKKSQQFDAGAAAERGEKARADRLPQGQLNAQSVQGSQSGQGAQNRQSGQLSQNAPGAQNIQPNQIAQAAANAALNQANAAVPANPVGQPACGANADKKDSPENEQHCDLHAIPTLVLDFPRLLTAQTAFVQALLLNSQPQLAELAGSKALSAAEICNYVQEGGEFDCGTLQVLATCYNQIIDVQMSIYCTELVQKRVSIEQARPHCFFNFRDHVSQLANLEAEAEAQRAFYMSVFIISFVLINSQKSTLGVDLLLNAIRPQVMHKFAQQNATCFCTCQLFARNAVADFQQLPHDQECFSMYQELCQNIITICACSEKKILCNACSNQTNILKQRRIENQRFLLQSDSAQLLQSTALQLIIHFKRALLLRLQASPAVAQIVYSALQFDVAQIKQYAEQLCDFRAPDNQIVQYLNSITKEGLRTEVLRFCAAIFQHIDVIDGGAFDFERFAAKIIHCSKELLTIKGEQNDVRLYYALDVLKSIISIYNKRFSTFQADIKTMKAEELLRKYNYIDFADQSQCLQKVLSISPEVLAFFEFDDNFIDKIVRLSKINANYVQNVSIFQTRQPGYLDSIIEFVFNSLQFCNNYKSLVASIQQLKDNNQQLIASISIGSDRPKLTYHLIFAQASIIDIINLIIQNPASLQYGLSFPRLQKVIELSTTNKMNQAFLLSLASFDYLKKLLLYYDFDTVESFFVQLLKALRLSSAFQSVMEAGSSATTQRELSNSLMGSYSLPPKTPNVQNMNMSLVKGMQDEFKLLSQQKQQFRASKIERFLIDSTRVLGRKYIDCAISFLTEAAFDAQFFDDDSGDPYELMASVALQYLQVFEKNGRLPERIILQDIAYYLAFCRQNSKFTAAFKDFRLLQMAFDASLPDQVLPPLMAVLYDQSRDFAEMIIQRFSKQIILVFKKNQLAVTAFHLIYSLIKFSPQPVRPSDGYKSLIAEFFKANTGRFSDFSDDLLGDIMLLFVKLLEKQQIYGFIEAKMPLEILRALNMRSSHYLKEMFLNIFELCKSNDEIRRDFRQNGFGSYLQQTKFDQAQKQVQKQLLLDYKK